ncbi:DUF4393 domain-containing protein [Bacillus cereus]|uniref:DUF4393 domain-containing protein n=1 Tax=Bacillus cereus TaxID=1396 RepID=UPI0011A841FC|nr:DUF4393 domain-containing protein [Bacillus cereus]MDA2650163.1 DUF4393 domain-containing protein [Bacillus cereus]
MEINVIPKFLDEAVIPLAQRAGNTLSSIWTIAFGGIDIYAEKSQLKRVHALNQFKEELEQAVSSIPEENIIEPPLHIVGPSLEASKYYFENDTLRIMFANLIAASINKETIQQAHPSFVEIIKQLSPLDAMNLALFKIKQHYPIARYNYFFTKGQQYSTCLAHVFLENRENMDPELNATSMSNLQRLGLVSINYEVTLSGEGIYEKYLNGPFYQQLKEEIHENNTNPKDTHVTFDDILVHKGIVELTSLGDDFIKICI